jgi:hypothetical protein
MVRSINYIMIARQQEKRSKINKEIEKIIFIKLFILIFLLIYNTNVIYFLIK